MIQFGGTKVEKKVYNSQEYSGASVRTKPREREVTGRQATRGAGVELEIQFRRN